MGRAASRETTAAAGRGRQCQADVCAQDHAEQCAVLRCTSSRTRSPSAPPSVSLSRDGIWCRLAQGSWSTGHQRSCSGWYLVLSCSRSWESSTSNTSDKLCRSSCNRCWLRGAQQGSSDICSQPLAAQKFRHGVHCSYECSQVTTGQAVGTPLATVPLMQTSAPQLASPVPATP